MASVVIPFLYVIIVFGGLYVFSHIYRRKLASQSPEPYFPPHTERNTYITLLQQNAPETTLKAALVRRAVADVKMVIRVREDKAALQLLLQKGTVGDDLWNSCLAAEKELEAEIYEVISEANSYVEGWGQLIFPTANEVIANERYRAAFDKTNEVKAQLGEHYGIISIAHRTC
ncbi:hypothetical protein FISHEDRAFT_38330 [Fistulina hepatica ATCC 64428]|nr:hypothetical protein FISHEDRAFT_38330 [Fistulina hepatica ATCC 64428]